MQQKQTAYHPPVGGADWAFLFFVFLLPAQLGFHFWPEFAYVFGIRVDYLSPTIYLTDIILAAVLGLWFLKKGGRKVFSGFSVSPTVVILISFFVYLLATSFFVAQNQGAAFYKLARLTELSLLFWYVYCNRNVLAGQGMFYSALSLAVIYSSILAIFQFLGSRSVGGVFWWLGERSFSLFTPGIALTEVGGREFLRSYGTFSHPNSMAGFLLLVLVLLAPWRGLLARTALGLGLVGIVLSFSQAVWLTGLFLALVQLIKRWKPNFATHLLVLTIFLMATLSIMPAFIEIPKIEENKDLQGRVGLFRAAGNMIVHSPFLGVGLNNFIPRLPEFSQTAGISWWLQPVHNIFLLVLSETGVVGFMFVFYLSGRFLLPTLAKPKNLGRASLLGVILLTGLVDHYWLTLWQNQLLATTTLALAFSSGRIKN